MPEQIVGRKVLVVDDVFTAGTTVWECARSAPAKICVATVARAHKADATGATRLPRVREDEEVLAAAI
jgi:orotate phosphoribosyltransferase